jgi:3-hydroxybutyryl-CoA dehydrogenase
MLPARPLKRRQEKQMDVIGVVGAGQMGNGIAHVAAAAGFRVVLQDVSADALAAALVTIRKNLGRQVKKERMTQAEADAVSAHIQTTTATAGLSDADLIVEAATENIELKYRIFEGLDAVAKPGAILATNTSSISVTAIAARTSRPDHVVGMHFMNPVPVMKLVELIPGLATSDEVLQAVRSAAEKMGKTTVVSRDMPGFIVNRVLMPYINEAVFAVYEGIASVEDIDTAMKLGTNVPMGPLTLADFIGLDTCLAIMQVLHDGMGGDSKYRPCPLLTKYVEAGWLGKKAGRGFYTY